MKRRNKSAVAAMARAAMIAAMYVALTYLASLLGLSSGVIQFRISEALCILPLIFPEAVIGLTLGCALANALTGALLLDVVFGTLATLIGALGALAFRKLPKKVSYLCSVPTILANAIIVPFVLKLVYRLEGGYLFFAATVGLGELICAGLLGAYLLFVLRKRVKLYNEN